MPASIQATGARVFTGPSVSAPWPCVRLNLTCTVTPVPGAALSRASRSAAAALPWMPEARRNYPREASEAHVADLVARLSIGLQASVGPWIPGFAMSPGRRGGTRLAIRYADAEVAAAATGLAVSWVSEALAPGARCDADDLIAQFKRLVRSHRLMLEQQLLLAEVVRRRIPWRRVAGAHRLGWGASQRWLSRILTDRTPALAVSAATRKPAAAAMMAAVGIPVPEHAIAPGAAEAVRIAGRLGYPVVMKPAQADMGVGVRLGLRDADEVRDAFDDVARHGQVLVERQHEGFDHRLLVVGGRLVAAARRVPARVFGDGANTVRALIDAVNRDPRRGSGHTTVLERIPVDEETARVLRRQGLGLDAVPEEGREVRLRLTANLSTGGTSEDVTARVHPDNRLLAERAAAVVGLDIAGVDFISPDIGRSHLEVGGIVCEINPNPGFRPHLAAPGSPDVVRAIVESLFPQGEDGRIPAAVITGTVGKTTTCRMVASILRAAGHTVGLATTDGVQIDDARIADGDEAGPRGASMVLADPAVTAAVLEAARGGIIRYGVGPDIYRVGAVLNVGTDHVGTDGVHSVEALARVKSTVLGGASGAWVLNADDPRCLAMADGAAGREVILTGRDAASAPLARHLAAGGRAVVQAGEGASARLLALRGDQSLVSIGVRDIPATFGGAAEFNVDNARYALAIALGLGVATEAIVAGLTRFAPDARWSRTRANMHAVGPLRVLIDYAHNTESFEAVSRFAARLEAGGRRILLLDAPGNRSDDAYGPMAKAVAAGFDHFVCTTSLPRGRAPGEVSRLLARALREAGVAPDRIEEIEPLDEALHALFAAARAGDLLVVPAEYPEQVLEHPACVRWRDAGPAGAGASAGSPVTPAGQEQGRVSSSRRAQA